MKSESHAAVRIRPAAEPSDRSAGGARFGRRTQRPRSGSVAPNFLQPAVAAHAAQVLASDFVRQPRRAGALTRANPETAALRGVSELSVNVLGCRVVTSDRPGWFSGWRRADS